MSESQHLTGSSPVPVPLLDVVGGNAPLREEISGRHRPCRRFGTIPPGTRLSPAGGGGGSTV